MYSENDIVKVENVRKCSNGESVNGLLLMKDYTKKTTKNGGFYFDGNLEGLGSMNFKAWGNSDAYDKLDTDDYQGQVISVYGEVNIFNGILSIIIKDLNAVDVSGEGISKNDFFASKYNEVAYFEAFKRTLGKLADENSVKIFDLVMKDIEGRFRVEFAARSMHDNCKNGLLAHSYKCLYISRLLTMYSDIVKEQGRDLSLIALGVALHDIGKVKEYTDGSIVGLGQIVSHHTFGVELLLDHKEEIVDLKGEEFFYRLCAIIEQHHGEFEERPRTIESYIVHLIDKFESDMQFLNQSLEGFEKGNQLQINGFKLS